MCSQLDCYKVICLVILFLVVQNVYCRSAKIKSHENSAYNTWDQSPHFENNTTLKDEGRGLNLAGGLFSLGKVLNFFPVGGERECKPQGYNIAKAGICINQYDCRQRDGRASGDCAHGLGVCCVFEVSCGAVIQNNLTYFMSPGFPELWDGDRDCNVTIEKTFAGIMQLRIDFIHFSIGQPNRSTGDCDEDAMILGEGDSKFTLCGQNHGQHIYYTLSTASEKRDTGELAGSRAVRLRMRMRAAEAARLWLVRVAQMPLAHSAPHACLQYHTERNGTIKSFNFATNGRHLASQDYKACIRKNRGICSVKYTPCDRRSFRIGPGSDTPIVMDPADVQTDDQMMPVDEEMMIQQDEEGSGDEPQIDPGQETPNLMSRIWTYIWSWMWGQARSSSWSRWSPYIQHYGNEDDGFRYFGYGNYGVGLQGYGRQRCQDRITIPCENEYLISSSSLSAGVCDPHHCGSTFCPGIMQPQDCKVETSITPFAVSFRFGPPIHKRSPEENIGVCLRYVQQPCNS